MDIIKLELDIHNKHLTKVGFFEYIKNIEDFNRHIFDDKLISLFKYRKNLMYLIDEAYNAVDCGNYYKSYILYSKYLEITEDMNSKISEMLKANSSVKKLEDQISDTYGTLFYKLKDKNYAFSIMKRAYEYKNNFKNYNIFYRHNYLNVLIADMKKVIEENKKDLKGDLIIYKSIKTPEVSLSQAYDYYSIKGRCYPEHSDKFWDPILEWVEFNFKKILDGSLLEINIDYINTSSLSYLYRFLSILEEKKLHINWYYDKGDDSMLETINDMIGQFNHNITKIELDA